MSRRIEFESALEMPLTAISLGEMSFNKTGSWRYLRPLYGERLAPCREACPAGTDLPRVLSLISDGKFIEAYSLIKQENPLPGVCGRVCYHPCETACNRGKFDEAVSIQALERFVSDCFFEERPKLRLNDGAKSPKTGKVAIVGSGPAGLACAYFLAREGIQATIYEAESEPGGMLRVGIPKYRLPRDVLDREIEEITRLGVEFKTGVRVGRDLELEELKREYDAVFIATGAHRSRPLKIPGEDEPGVRAGLEFLKAVNAGQPPEIGKRVLVIGGGNTAIDAVRTALRLGASPTIVYRRTRAEMPAVPDEIEEAEHEGIELVFLAAPRSIRRAGEKLEVEFIRMELGEPDESGRRRPVPIPGSEFTLEADALLKAIGEEPELPSLPKGREGLFIGGDAKTGPSTVVEAIASGKRAAYEIARRLLQGKLEAPKPPTEKIAFEALNLDYFAPLARTDPPRLAVDQRIRSFSEVVGPLPLEGAVKEAGRCFSCGVCNCCDNCLVFCPDVAITRMNGAYKVNLDFCKGCGICAQECPRGAISLVEEEAA